MAIAVNKIANIYTLPMPDKRIVKQSDSKIAKIIYYLIDKLSRFFHMVKLFMSHNYRMKCLRLVQKEVPKPINPKPIVNDPPKVNQKEKQLDSAAVMIQKIFRGFLVRKKIGTYQKQRQEMSQLHTSSQNLKTKIREKKGTLDELLADCVNKESCLHQTEENLIHVKTKIGAMLTNESILNEYMLLHKRIKHLDKKNSIKNQFVSFFDRNKNEKLELIKEERLSLYTQLTSMHREMEQILGEVPINSKNVKLRLESLSTEMDNNEELMLMEKKHKENESQLREALLNVEQIQKKIGKLELDLNKQNKLRRSLKRSLAKSWKEICSHSIVPTKQKKVDPPLKIEHVENSVDIPVLIEEKKLSIEELATDSISTHIHSDMGHLFSLLFQKFPQNSLLSWTCDNQGSFKLNLSRKIHIWIPCTDHRLKGGVVMEFGNEHHVIEGKLDKAAGIIYFHSGFKNLCIAKVAFFTKQAESKMVQIVYRNKDSIDFVVKYLSQETTKTNYANLVIDWGIKSKTVLTNPWEFIKSN